MAWVTNRVNLGDRLTKQVATTVSVVVKFRSSVSADQAKRALLSEDASPDSSIEVASQVLGIAAKSQAMQDGGSAFVAEPVFVSW